MKRILIIIILILLFSSLSASSAPEKMKTQQKKWSLSANFFYQSGFLLFWLPDFGIHIDGTYRSFHSVIKFSGYQGSYDDYLTFQIGMGVKHDFLKSDKYDLCLLNDVLYSYRWGDRYKVNYDGVSYVESSNLVLSYGIEFSVGRRFLKFNTGFLINMVIYYKTDIYNKWEDDEVRKGWSVPYPGFSFYSGFKF